ncbi:hypothetical protein [Paenibacillus sp. LHD-38]|uniref:hypothetical protein n=1 Tax=Paenibacillus sp. LHD-38 TaxID=3072143 RepID=UPI00280C9C02|nr:hypothetical protein [Paenibacillus sp. LHD-38]MDQ8733865.1 hypothetical protein [Paenibacillus sp. LHD-38]
MNIEELFTAKLPLGKDFQYMDLYNDSRGAVFKEHYKSLIKQAIAKNVITVEKYLVAENAKDKLYEIVEETDKLQYTLVQCLKDYHQENDFVIAPLIYLLRKLDSQHMVLVDSEGQLKIKSKFDIEIRPRIDGRNATPRLYLPKEKIAISSTNDNVENLGQILAVKDVNVYIVDKEYLSNNIYAYKINRNERFFEVSNGYEDRVLTEIFNDIT